MSVLIISFGEKLDEILSFSLSSCTKNNRPSSPHLSSNRLSFPLGNHLRFDLPRDRPLLSVTKRPIPGVTRAVESL
jgi:hypothetical protein